MERKSEEEMKQDQESGCDDDDSDEDTGDDDDSPVEKGVSTSGPEPTDRKCVPGIVYLGHIPPRLRPKHLRNMLSSYGEVGRVFLQPEGEGQLRRSPPGSDPTCVPPPPDQQVRRRKRRSGLKRGDFTEGWVEFRDKRVAKKVAASLHNTPMGTRRRQKFYSDLWSIKVPQQGDVTG